MIDEYKQCIIVRTDLKLSLGKLAAQVAHGSISSYDIASKEDKIKWKKNGQKKVVLKVNTLREMINLYN